MSSLASPALLTRLVDDAAVSPPGLAAMPHAVREHGTHRTAWYAPLTLVRLGLTEPRRTFATEQKELA